MSPADRRGATAAWEVAYERADQPGAEAHPTQTRARARGRRQLDCPGRTAAVELWRVPRRAVERRTAGAPGGPDPPQAPGGGLPVRGDRGTIRLRIAART